uniref:rRNA N-glycosylase n=1 Tax=Oryza brachyantha TaxID=4533 RepID=J3L9K8_ORYBR
MDHRLSLVLLLVVAGFSHPQAQPAVGPDIVPFNLATETYEEFFTRLTRLLRRRSTTPPYNPPEVMGRYVLGRQRPQFYGPTSRWLMVDIVAGGGGPSPSDDDDHQVRKTTLGMLQEDLTDFDPTGLPGSYLGKRSAIEAAATLASYDPTTATEAANVQAPQAVTRFVLMISEALRFSAIRDTFSGQKWGEESRIDEIHTKYVVFLGKALKIPCAVGAKSPSFLEPKQRG